MSGSMSPLALPTITLRTMPSRPIRTPTSRPRSWEAEARCPRQLGGDGLLRRDAAAVGALQHPPLRGPDALDVAADGMLGDDSSSSQAVVLASWPGAWPAPAGSRLPWPPRAVPAPRDLW